MARNENAEAPKLHAEILKSVQKHPNVFDITPLKERPIELLSISRTGLLVGGNVFSLRVRLPERLHKWREFLVGESAPPEEFHVFSSGSLFAALADIKDYPARTNIGHEYRDLLKEQIERMTPFKCPRIGPSPIHPDFYIVFRQKRAKEAPRGAKIYAIRDDVFLVLDSNAHTSREIATELFQELEHSLLSFYGLQLARLDLILYETEIFNHFYDLSSRVKQLLATSWWHLFELAKFSSQARTSLSHVHTRLVEYGAAFLNFTRERNRYVDEIRGHPLLAQIREYFTHMSEAQAEPPEALTPALNYFGQELQTFGNIRSVIIASFLSAVAGALLYALFTRFLLRFDG